MLLRLINSIKMTVQTAICIHDSARVTCEIFEQKSVEHSLLECPDCTATKTWKCKCVRCVNVKGATAVTA